MKRKKDYYLEALLKEQKYLFKAIKLTRRRVGFEAFKLYENAYNNLIDAMVEHLRYSVPWRENEESEE